MAKLSLACETRGSRKLKVLIAVDGSGGARSAVEDCAKRLWPAGTSFRILTVIENIEIMPVSDAVTAALTAQPTEMVSRFVGEFEERHADCDTSSEVLHGYAKEQILDAAKRWNADLIVVGSRGHNVAARVLLGSVSRDVLHAADCSVRVVRHSVIEDEVADAVIVATDRRESAKVMLNHLLSRGWAPGTTFICVNVLAPLPPVGVTSQSYIEFAGRHSPEMRASSEQVAQECADRLNAKFGQCATSYSLDGDPAQRIVEFAEEKEANLIAIGTHNRGLLERLFLGSVSAAVVSNSHCSVEVVKR